MTVGDTIVALSSGRPPAAIAIVRVSGPQAMRAGTAIAGRLGPPRQAVVRRLRAADGATIDHALVLAFAAPATATGEDIVEFQCHGGKAVVAALISALVGIAGVRLAEPGEFTRRALLGGRIDLTQAEGLAELLQAETEAQRKTALRRSEGALRNQIEQWRDRLLGLSAGVEAAIDYADDDETSAPLQLGDLGAMAGEIAALLAAPRVEKLRDGLRVVIAGPPNVGKSSLVNALAGQQRSIVTAIPGTTRDRIEAPMAIDGIPFVLVDTAGLRESSDAVESIGIDLARQEAVEADILLWLGEPAMAPPGAVAIHSKSDLHPAEDSLLPVSSVTGEGLDALRSLLVARGAGMIPNEVQLALNQREAESLAEADAAIRRAANEVDPVLIAEELRLARSMFDQIVGRAGVDDLLDALFGRFCLGK